MIALLQRVCQASVEVEGRCIGEIASGVFGAHMKVALVNDGPVTFWLQVT